MSKLTRWLKPSSAPRLSADLAPGRFVPRGVRLEDRVNPAPIPAITGLTPTAPETLLGETTTLNFNLTNTGDQTGYSPFVMVALDTTGPDGVNGAYPTGDGFGAPTFSVTGSAQPLLGTIPVTGPTYTNPFTGVTGAVPGYGTGNIGIGDLIYVYRAPFGSFTPGQTTAASLTLPMSTGADVGTPLGVGLDAHFRDGTIPVGGTPIDGPDTVTTVTPILWRLNKVYLGPEDETATGPNYKRQYRLDVDIAPGQQVQFLQVRDLLANSMQWTGAAQTTLRVYTVPNSTPGVGGTILSTVLTGTTATAVTPGGEIVASFGNRTGIAGVDASLDFEFFVPRDRSTGAQVLPQPPGTDSTTDQNTGSAGGTWNPLDARDPQNQTVTKAAPDNGPHTLQEHSVATQKTVAAVDLSGNPVSGVRPGFTLLRYDIDFQVSDYYAVDDLILEDLLGDGQRLYLAGGFAPTLTVNNPWVYSGGGTRAGTSTGGFTGTGTIDYSRQYTLSGNTDRTPSNGIEGYAEGGPNTGAYNLLAPGAIDGKTFLRFNISDELVARGLSGLLVGGEIPNSGGAPANNNPTAAFGAAQGRVTFYALVKREFADDFPSTDRSVDQGDVLGNQVPLIRGVHLSPTDLADGTPTPTGTVGTDDTGASIAIPYGEREKRIFAINGQAIGATANAVNVQAGDQVTYLLTYTLPTSSFENLRFIDFPPLPVMPVAGSYTFNRDPNSPNRFTAGNVTVFVNGADPQNDTYFNTFAPGLGNGRNPTLTPDTQSNSLTMNFGTFEDPNNLPTRVTVLVTFQVGNQSFASDLFLTNQLRLSEGSTNAGDTTVEAINQFELVRPTVDVNKGVVGFNTTGLTLGGVAFTDPTAAPSFSGGPVYTNGQVSAIGGRNGTLADGLDAGDTVRFAIVARNTGQGDAFDVEIRDTVQAAFDRNSFANLRVYRGDGTLLTGGGVDYTSSYVPGTGQLIITLVDNYTVGNVGGAAEDARSGALSRGAGDAGAITNGSNTVVVIYDVTLTNSVAPNQTITNTAAVTTYSTAEGGPDFTDPNQVPGGSDPTDTANVIVQLVRQQKTLVGTELNRPGNNAANQVVIGELATYELLFTLPEGMTPAAVIRDLLDEGLALTDILEVELSNGLTVAGYLAGNTPADWATNAVTLTASTTVSVSNNRQINFSLGDITNNTNANNAGAETIRIRYRVVALNTNANPRNNQAGQTRNNSARFEWTGNAATLARVVAGQTTGANGTATGTPTPLAIVEPTVTTAKTVANISNPNGTAERVRADAGDTVEYTIVLTASGTTAFDVTLSDLLPAQLTGETVFAGSHTGTVFVNGAGGTITTANFEIVGGVLRFVTTDNIDLEQGATVTVVVRGTWSGAAGNVITNTAETRWTSLDGTPGNRAAAITGQNGVERTGDDGALNGGALNDYRTGDGADIESPVLVRKTIVATSELSTTPAVAHPTAGGTADRMAVGELVRYRLYVSVAEGLSRNFQIRDYIPTGMRFVNDGSARYVFVATTGGNMTSASNGAILGLGTVTVLGNGGTLAGLLSAQLTGTFADGNVADASGGPGTGDPALYTSGQGVFFRFGDLTNADSDTDAEFVVIEFNVLLENITANQAGNTRTNNFAVLIDTDNDGTPGFVDVAIDANGDGSGTGDPTVAANDPTNTGSGTPALSNDAVVTVVEPNIAITKQAVVTTGGTVTYRLTLTNTGANASQANDVRVLDVLNATNFGLLLGSVSVTLGNGSTGVTNNSAGNTVDVTVTVVPVNGTVVIEYQVNVLVTPTGAATLDNTGTATATSLTGANGFATDFFGTVPGTLGTPGTATGERTGADGVGGPLNDYATQSVARLGSLGDRVYVDYDGDGVQDAGEPGVVGAVVTVRWAGVNGTFGDGDDSVITATTGANGVYTVTGLPVGAGQNYRVSVLDSGAPFTAFGLNTVTDAVDDGALTASNTADITLDGGTAATTNNRTQDFGYRGTATLGDRVWHDLNNNGVQEAGEPGIPGVRVTLVWHGVDDALGGGDDLTLTATTDAGGNYTFINLPGGSYTATVNTADLPDDFSQTFDLDGTATAHTAATALTTGQNRTDVDFGYRGTATLGDRVWYDVDGDGVQDNSAADGFEPGIAGAVVTLVFGGDDGDLSTAADNITYTTTTDAAGNYLFAGLFGGDGTGNNYRVTVTPPAGYPVNTGDPDGVLNSTTDTRLEAGEDDRTQDFGYRGPNTRGLGNFVWEDTNGNGRQDGSEPVIVGVRVELLDAAGIVIDATTTGAGGIYGFTGLAASAKFGDYRVRFVAPGGYTFTPQDSAVATDATDSDANPGTGTTGNITLSDEIIDTIDAGLYRPVTIGDTVWYDTNGNGTQDAAEATLGIPGVVVVLDYAGLDGTFGTGDDVPGQFTATTNASGQYTFANLPPGSYRVRVQDASVPVAPLVYTTAGGNTQPSTLTSGTDDLARDFGVRGVGQVGDTLFLDVNNNGLPDAGEGLANVVVTLSGDLDGDGTVEASETLTTTTDGLGFYQFTSLRTTAGGVPYTVRVVPTTLPQDGPGTPIPNTVDPNGGNDNTSTTTLTTAAPGNQAQDFGYRNLTSGIIGDTVFLDVDGDGVADVGEGISGVRVVLTATVNGSPVNATLTTTAAGTYLFSNLPVRNNDATPITYTVTVVTADLPQGVTNTADPDGGADSTSQVTFTPGNLTDLNQDFGYRGDGSIGDRVFLDFNANGVWDPGEGITVPVVLTADVNGDGVQDLTVTVTTDADGAYLFDNLPVRTRGRTDTPINYTVTVAASQLPAGVSNTVDPDGTTDSTWTGTLTAGTGAPDRRDIDFGYRGTGSLGDRLWFDSNGDGVQDPVALEPGVPFAELTLTYAGQDDTFGTADDATVVVTADANGAYRFTNLPAGNFRVNVTPGTLPANVSPTFDLDGIGSANVADTTLTAGQTRTDVDFGYRSAAGLGDRVWLDQDRDGLQDAGEFGVVGAVVRLTLAGRDGQLGTADDLTYTATTGDNGVYSFPGLPVYGAIGDQFRVDVLSVPAVGGVVPVSDLDSAVGAGDQTAAGTLGANQTRTDVDFGYSGTGTIAGRVFLDGNNNGVQDAGEPNLPNVVVTLTGTDVFGNPVVDPNTGGPYRVTTDANGDYRFVNLIPGTYTATEAQPAGLLDGIDTPGSLGGTAGQGAADTDAVRSIALPIGGVSVQNNFAEIPPASIVGSVYEDRNRNRRQDPGEPGIPGTVITLVGTDDRGTVTRTLTTDASGNYRFDDLRPGVYTLTQTQPAGYVQSGNTVGDAGGGEPRRDVINNIVLAPGQAGLNYLFGEARPPLQVVGVDPPVLPNDPTKGGLLSNSFVTGGIPAVPNFTALGSVNAQRPPEFAVTADGPGGRYVRVFDLTSGNERFRFEPFPGFPGGMSAALGDVTGDGIPDVIVGAGAGGGPHVKIYDGNSGLLIRQFMAFEVHFPGGVTVSSGDFNGDGRQDVIVGAGLGGGPRVRVLSGGDPNTVLTDFYGIDDPAFRGGVRVAAGDVNNDGVADLVVSAGMGGGPRVAAYSGTSVGAGFPARLFADFFAFEQELRTGAYVTVGDVDGDGFADLITGAGESGGPRVTAYSGRSMLQGVYTNRVADFFAFDAFSTGGVRVAAKDLDGDGRTEVMVGSGPGAWPWVRFFDPRTQRQVDQFAASWYGNFNGVYVG
jgi:uncharacterized repeat protein (TIGR01451 family)